MADFRMPDVNKVMLAGRLTGDPELRYLPSGLAVCKLRLAATSYYKDRTSGERKESTVYVDVTSWDKQAEYIGQRLRQGNPILVEGKLKYDAWDDKSTGQKRSKVEVQAIRIQELAWSGDRPSGGGPAPAPATSMSEPQPPQDDREPIPEDDIPF